MNPENPDPLEEPRKQLPISEGPHPVGVVLVDHGSRKQESNDLLHKIVEAIVLRGDFQIIEPAHMELAEPTIQMAFEACVARGAKQVVVMPYFLGPGRHAEEDIPQMAREAASRHPEIPFTVANPLGLHADILNVVRERVVAALHSSAF